MAVIDQLKLLFTPTLTEAQILTVYHRVNFDLEEAVLQLSLQLDQLELAGGKSANCIPPVKKDRGPLTKLDSDQSKKDLDLLQGMFTEKAIKELQQLYNKFKGNVDDVVQHVLSQPQSQNAITNAKKQNNKQAKKVNQVKANNQPKNTTTTATTTTTTTAKSARQAKNASKWNKQKTAVSKDTDVPQTITLDPTAYPIFSCTKPEKVVKKKTSSKFSWDRQCYLQWSNAQWEEFNSTLGQVKSIFPTLSNFTMIHSFLKNNGDLSQTLECCCQTSEYIQNEGISDTDHAYNIELEANCDSLIDMFPTFTRFQLVLLLMICQNNMDAALQSLLDMQYIIQSNFSSSSITHSSSKKKTTFTPAPDLLRAKYNNKGNILSLNVNEGPNLSLNEDAVLSLRHSSREIMDDPDIYRERAQDFYDKRNGLYEKAVDRHKNRNKRNNHAGVAFYYAEEGRDLERKAQFQNELAVRSLINEKLANRSDPYEVDLHGFRVQEAIDFALEQCSIWYIRDMKRVESGRCRKLHPLTFVTGKGVHNADQKSRLMPALVRKFREEGWKVEPNTGYFRILGVDESTRKG